MKTYLKQLANRINISLTDEQVEKYILYKNLLQEWNDKINLTAIVKDEEIILKHFIDSLTIEKYIPKGANVIDVGTGAGFPGLAVRIYRDDIELTLLDSLNKRLVFLEDVINKCRLSSVELVHGRAEDFGNNVKYREKFDIATARAVANLSTLSEFCIPFVKVGGAFISMKGNNKDEIIEAENAIKTLGGKIEKVDEIVLPDSDILHQIIIINKEKCTNKIYPRKAGTPEKKPL